MSVDPGSHIEMTYDFRFESYDTEILKVLGVWSERHDADLAVRPKSDEPRSRSVLEPMVHQCVSEDIWFRMMLGIDSGEGFTSRM